VAKKSWNKPHSVTPDPEPKPLEESPSVIAAEPAPQPWRKKRWNAPASSLGLVPASSVAADEAQARVDAQSQPEPKDDPTYRPPSGILMHKGQE
jgi:hypothetical protein